MTSRERVLAHLDSQPVDRLPVMPITMRFACDLLGAKYRDYETDHRVLVEGQLRVAEQIGFDYVNTMSDPTREAADCGATIEFFENSPAAVIEEHALLADKSVLARLKTPDPLGGRTRLHIRGNTRFALEGMGRLGCAVVDLDSLCPVAEGRTKMGDGPIILGNLNPVTVLRAGTPESIRAAVAECHRAAGPRFIVGAGCEVPRDTPHENVRALAEYARTAPTAEN